MFERIVWERRQLQYSIILTKDYLKSIVPVRQKKCDDLLDSPMAISRLTQLLLN